MPSRAVHVADWRGAYPERWEPGAGRLERLCAPMAGIIVRQMRTRRLRLHRLVRAVTVSGSSLAHLGEAELRGIADSLRHRLRREGFQAEVVARVFALVREMAGRKVGMRHFDVQVMGYSMAWPSYGASWPPDSSVVWHIHTATVATGC